MASIAALPIRAIAFGGNKLIARPGTKSGKLEKNGVIVKATFDDYLVEGIHQSSTRLPSAEDDVSCTMERISKL